MRQKLIAFGLIAGAAVIAWLMHIASPMPAKAPAPDATLAVETQKLYRHDVALKVKSQGSVQPRTRTTMVSEVAGTIVDVSDHFVVGGTFSAGDVMIRLDKGDYAVAVQRANARLSSANALLELERARTIQAKKEWAMTGRPEAEAPALALRTPYLAEAEAAVLQAESEVQQAQLKLRRTVIRAPYSGMITKKIADLGQYISPGSRICEIFATDFVEIRLPLTEKDLATMGGVSPDVISRAAPVELMGSVNGANHQWQGKMIRSEGVVNEFNRAQYVVISVADPYGLTSSATTARAPILVGTFVRATLPGKTLKNVFSVPRSALLQGSQVAIADAQNRLRLKSVTIVFSDDDYYYVTANIDDGTTFVVSAIGTAIEGLKLHIANTGEQDQNH